MKRCLLFIVLLVFLTVFAFSGPFPEYSRLDCFYKALLEQKFVPYSKGFTLEELIRLDLPRRFPEKRYEITGGLEMSNAEGYAIGEIDILVLDKITKKVVLIGEAKVWKNLSKAIVKAKSQLKKLKEAINSGKISSLYFNPDPKRKFTMDIFKNAKYTFETFGCKGAKKYGFDNEFNITPDEVSKLNDALVKAHFSNYKPSPLINKYVAYVKRFKFAQKDDKSTFITCVKCENEKSYSPSKFKVLEDVSYFNESGKDLGHVKLLYLDKTKNKAAYVANVVYGWSNLKNASKVYNNYLSQFHSSLQDGKITLLKSKYPSKKLPVSIFDGIYKMDSYCYKGSKACGFTKELQITPDDVFYIRMKASGRL